MDLIDIHINEQVHAAFVVKVPCSFSPTGIHYVTVMTGQKTAVEGTSHRLATRPHLAHVSCECMEHVPEDYLQGMMALREDEGVKHKDMNQCYAVVKRFREVVHMPYRTRDDKEAGQKARKDLPLALRGTASFIMANRRYHDPKVAERKPALGAAGLRRRAARAFTKVFNFAANGGRMEKRLKKTMKTMDLGSAQMFTIKHDVERGCFGVFNDHNEVAAWRFDNRWYLPDDWYGSKDCEKWARYVGTGFKYSCPICEKTYTNGRGDRYSNGHDSKTSEFHRDQAMRKFKIGLVGTRFGFREEVLDFQSRAPRLLDKFPQIKLLRRSDFDAIFGESRQGKL